MFLLDSDTDLLDFNERIDDLCTIELHYYFVTSS